ncbi:PQQ-binding-like beta-propeller repeat protein [Halapricum desulfuricans]|nr:PQQ-binding-like beta-propeller repeat protein [Halapricum desulfuricans]
MRIRAIDVDDGRQRWMSDLDTAGKVISPADTDRLVAAGPPILLADTDRLVVVDTTLNASKLYLFDHDGRELARANVPNVARAILRDGAVTLVSTGKQLRIETYDTETLDQQWQNTIEVGNRAHVHLAAGPESLVTTVGQTDSQRWNSENELPIFLVGFDRDSGQQRWQTTVPETRYVRSIAIGDTTVYLGTQHGFFSDPSSVFAYALDDGAERWRIKSKRSESGSTEPVWRTVHSILVSDGRLYLWDGETLVALEEP